MRNVTSFVVLKPSLVGLLLEMDKPFTASPIPVNQTVKLDKEVIIQSARKARREGIIAGITSGFLAGLLGKHVLRFDRKQTLLSGILTGVLSGYFFAQAFFGSRMTEAVVQETRRRAASSELVPDESLQDPAAGRFA